MEWSFHYHGPREPRMDYKCVTCLASKTEECPTHGKAPPPEGCAHCLAAAGGPCQAHWGIQAALDAHVVEDDAKADFALAKAFVESEMASCTAKLVLVRAFGVGPLSPKQPREFHIEVCAAS